MARRWRVSQLAAGLCLAATAATAAQTPASQPPAGAAEATQSVIAYPASFFASMSPDTAYDMVLRVPGFAFDDGSSVRGFAGAAGNVLIDGQRPASKTDDLVSILRRLPASQVERIDLIRGAQPGIDMQGKAVVANVIRRKGQGFSGVASVGQYTTGDGWTDPQAKLEGKWRGDGRTLEGSLFAFKGHDNSQGSGSHTIFGPAGQVLDASRMHNTGPTWQYEATSAYETPLMGGKFRVNLTLEDQPYQTHNRDEFRVAGEQVQHTEQDQTDGELGLHYDRPLATGLTLELFGLQHLDKFGFASTFDTAADSQVFRLTRIGGESIARGIVHWRPTPSLTVDSGGEFAYNRLESRTNFTENGVAIQIPAANVTVEEKRGEAFATATWRPLTTLTVEAGLRFEGSTISSTGDVVLSKTLTYPKPRILVTWSPDPLDQVRVRVEREVGQLDFNSFVASAALNANGVAAGNPDLLPQQDWAFEAAYDRHFWKDGVVSLTLRHLILKDAVDRVPVFSPSGVFDEPGNIGDGHEDDVVVSFSAPLDRFGISGGVLRGLGTWRASQVTDPTTGRTRRISGQHPVDAQLHFSQDLPRLKLTWGVDVSTGVTERFFRFDEVDTNRTNTVATVYLDYKARPDLTWRFLAETDYDRFDATREVFAGPRSRDPLQFVDVQNRRFGPVFFVRLRKTFG
jgi:hypothetical protein